MISRIVFLLEELSAREFLKSFLPKLPIPAEIDLHYLVFEGKQDLENNIIQRLRHWRLPGTTQFIIIRDQDSGDCKIIADNIRRLCLEAGRADTLIRIACRELESWYLGDLSAVEAGLSVKGISRLQRKEKFRTPDKLANPSGELKILTGYKYQKVSGSREIGRHLKTEFNTSYSFNKFVEGINRILLQ